MTVPISEPERSSLGRAALGIEIQHLREIYELRNQYVDKALELARSETERRLDNLNHEAERLKQMQGSYYPREMAEAFVNNVNKRLATIERNMWLSSGGLAVLVFVIKYMKIF